MPLLFAMCVLLFGALNIGKRQKHESERGYAEKKHVTKVFPCSNKHLYLVGLLYASTLALNNFFRIHVQFFFSFGITVFNLTRSAANKMRSHAKRGRDFFLSLIDLIITDYSRFGMCGYYQN